MIDGTAKYLSYYPKYAFLDKILEQSGKKKLVIHLDLKNAFQALYLEPFVKHIVRESVRSRHIDTGMLMSFIEFVSWHKVYAKKRGIDLQFYCFFEMGNSEYHEYLLPSYKGDRKSNDLFTIGESYTDMFYKVLAKNYEIIERIGNRIPGVNVLVLKFLEADFMPYYLIERVLKDPDDWAHVIYSSDKDHLQVIGDKPNIFQFRKLKSKTTIVGKNDIWTEYLKQDIDLGNEYLPLMMAINGDMGDKIPGIKGIGEKTLIKIYEEIIQVFGEMDIVYNSIAETNSIDVKNFITNTKPIQKIRGDINIVIRNLKLISYKLIADYLDSNKSTMLIKRKKHLYETVNMDLKQKVYSGRVFYDAFEAAGLPVTVEEDVIYNLFN